MKNKTNSSCLNILTRAAMALPALAQLANADAPSQKTEIGYRYSQYEEDKLNQADILSGSNERYSVDNQQFRLVTPIASDMSLSVDATYETMSGASAYGTALDGQGEHKLVMSGASIKDTRSDVQASIRKNNENNATTLSGGYSHEDDYVSYNVGIEGEWSAPDRRSTWSGGLEYSQDSVNPEPVAGVKRVTDEDRHALSGFFALANVVNSVWQIQGGMFFAQNSGYLDDPYKSRDFRPEKRAAWGLNINSRYFVRAVKAALHTDYRFYSDDWGVEAHTLELAWHQSLTDQIRVVPRIRYYSQSQADFYVDADSGERDGHQSSDYRLSPFGAMSYGASVIFDQGAYQFTLAAEQYDSDGKYALKKVDIESPALVDYTLLTFGIDYRF